MTAPTTVCILAHGAPSYYESAAEAAASVLRYTPFVVFVAHGGEATPACAANDRTILHRLPDVPPSDDRARRFLRKFEAMDAALAATTSARLLLLDADAAFVRRCSERMVRRALGDRPIAMVEQPTVTGSTMDRRAFLTHYTDHTLALLAPSAAPPPLARFRYFNSGVVLATRAEWRRLIDWARATIDGVAGPHAVGAHMIADQDYFQLWVHTVHPDRCRALPWQWNHCEYWHTPFPRPGALIAHFSNFCDGPAQGTPARMRAVQHEATHWRARLAAAVVDLGLGGTAA